MLIKGRMYNKDTWYTHPGAMKPVKLIRYDSEKELVLVRLRGTLVKIWVSDHGFKVDRRTHAENSKK